MKVNYKTTIMANGQTIDEFIRNGSIQKDSKTKAGTQHLARILKLEKALKNIRQRLLHSNLPSIEVIFECAEDARIALLKGKK